MAGRSYRVYATWHVECSECGEDITDHNEPTRGSATEARDAHEAWHQREENHDGN